MATVSLGMEKGGRDYRGLKTESEKRERAPFVVSGELGDTFSVSRKKFPTPEIGIII